MNEILPMDLMSDTRSGLQHFLSLQLVHKLPLGAALHGSALYPYMTDQSDGARTHCLAVSLLVTRPDRMSSALT